MKSDLKLATAISMLQEFCGRNLTSTLADIESTICRANSTNCAQLVASTGADSNVIAAAGLLKHFAGQNNVVIHALGILLCLPNLLNEGEVVEYVSLGAGNTGRAFDLVTSERIAEFKFIHWRGGPESIRQNALFKDFYLMAESRIPKKKFLYVLETERPLKFLNSKRSLRSVLSRNVKLKMDYQRRYGSRYATVGEYYSIRKDDVLLQDVSDWIPTLSSYNIDLEEAEA